MLAIIIPFYKITFFEETLISLMNQTDKRFKIYIGNDASPDDCTFLLNKYKESFDFVYKKFDTNLGGTSLVNQWERCLALVNDEQWVIFLGDDDVLGDNVVSAFYSHLNMIENKAEVIRFATAKIDASGDTVSHFYHHPEVEMASEFLFRETRSSLSEYAFKKDRINKIKFKNFPLAWFSDVLAVLEFSDFKFIYTINSAYVYVRISDESISGKQDNYKSKNDATFKFYLYLMKFYAEKFNPDQSKEILKRLNKSVVNDKKNIKNFTEISFFYMKKGSFRLYLSFLKEALFSFLR